MLWIAFHDATTHASPHFLGLPLHSECSKHPGAKRRIGDVCEAGAVPTGFIADSDFLNIAGLRPRRGDGVLSGQHYQCRRDDSQNCRDVAIDVNVRLSTYKARIASLSALGTPRQGCDRYVLAAGLPPLPYRLFHPRL